MTAKERLFCTYYALSRNGREAAAKAGYRRAEKSALHLLESKAIKAELDRIDKKRLASESTIAAGYYRLAFGCISDAVELVFRDEITAEELEQMDLFNVSDIKKAKGGGVEIKFFDRLKALEKLQQLSVLQGDTTSNPFYEAIERGAAALRTKTREGAAE